MATHSPSGAARRNRDLRQVGRTARAVSRNAVVGRLTRLGLAVRGLLYFLPGVLALRWALGHRAASVSPAGAIDVIGHEPMGRALLLVVAVGVGGYSLWGFIRAIMDPLRRGHSPTGLALRLGYAFSAIAYLGLFVATIGLLTGGRSQAAPSQDWTLLVLSHPFGRAIVVVVGLCWIFGSGLVQIITGVRGSFQHDLKLDRLHREERRWAIIIGRIGLVSRGAVFMIIGCLIVAAALHRPEGPGTGIEAAFAQIVRQRFGHYLLAATGVGLMTFGIYSAMSARWLPPHGEPAGARR